MSRHTVAVMGLGVRGKIHIHGLLENPDYYEIVGLCDIDQAAMDRVAAEYHLEQVPRFLDAEEMLKTVRPEVFVFVTYPDMRLNLIRLGIKYGVKAVSLERPWQNPCRRPGRWRVCAMRTASRPWSATSRNICPSSSG